MYIFSNGNLGEYIKKLVNKYTFVYEFESSLGWLSS